VVDVDAAPPDANLKSVRLPFLVAPPLDEGRNLIPPGLTALGRRESEMSLATSLKRMTYNATLIALVSRLGLRPALRKCYYLVARPRDGRIRVEVNGVSALFYVRTPAELRNLDPAGGGQEECRLLSTLMSLMKDGGTFYDVGSNVGLFAIIMAKALAGCGEVLAFEPFSGAHAHLQENVALNGVTNIRVFKQAMGDSNRTALLYLGNGNADSSLTRPPTGVEKGHEIVEVVQGDSYIQSHGLPLPRGIKIDVEGFEYAVLEGLRQTLREPTCEFLCCEIHPNLLPQGTRQETVVDFIKSLGFARIDVRQRKDTLHALALKA
jgi:FkbM family methyltransferase